MVGVAIASTLFQLSMCSSSSLTVFCSSKTCSSSSFLGFKRFHSSGGVGTKAAVQPQPCTRLSTPYVFGFRCQLARVTVYKVLLSTQQSWARTSAYVGCSLKNDISLMSRGRCSSASNGGRGSASKAVCTRTSVSSSCAPSGGQSASVVSMEVLI